MSCCYGSVTFQAVGGGGTRVRPNNQLRTSIRWLRSPGSGFVSPALNSPLVGALCRPSVQAGLLQRLAG